MTNPDLVLLDGQVAAPIYPASELHDPNAPEGCMEGDCGMHPDQASPAVWAVVPPHGDVWWYCEKHWALLRNDATHKWYKQV